MRTLLVSLPPQWLDNSQLDKIRQAAPDMRILQTHDEAEIEADVGRIEIVAGFFPYRMLSRASALRWIQEWGAGADWLMRHPEAVEMDFVLTNASGVHAIPISEHIFAFLFALSRGFPKAMRGQVHRQWVRFEAGELVELAGKTLLLIGVGAIGQRTARLASAFDMKVIGVRRNPAQTVPGVACMVGPEQLLEVLPEADFVVLTVPLTPQTERLIGARELRAMKQSAIIVNTGRGKTIDQQALVQALSEGWIAGAGLDVTDPEPLPAESPLWQMENVLITPHYAGLTPHYSERALEIFLDNLRRYRAGEPLVNVVDKNLGY